MTRIAGLVALVVLASATPAWADEDAPAETATALTIGSKAPALDIQHWIANVEMDKEGYFTPVTEYDAGHVYVLEFFATWCGPCVASMPHLTELQEKYAGKVSIIGISDESLPKVVRFLFQKYRDGKIHNDRIGYMLTTDPDLSVKNAIFKAAGRRGIPSAFIVGKQGHIEWIGHPGRMDDALDAVVNDTWDRDAFKAKYEAEQEEKALMRETGRKLRSALQTGDVDGALGALDDLIAKRPDLASPRVQKFMILHMANRADAAYAGGEELLQKLWDDAQNLNQVAWFVVDDKRVQKRDFDFALKAAARANELKESKDAAILDTLARVYFEQGELNTAIEWQSKAVEHASEGKMGDELRATLDRYKKALADKQAADERAKEPVAD